MKRGQSAMEIVPLPPCAVKAPSNFRCLLIGASEAGKSTFISLLIKNKEKIFQKPGYAKFIFCSPHLGHPNGGSTDKDVKYQEQLTEWAQPSEIIFMNKMVSLEELEEEAEATNGRLMLIIDDFGLSVFSTDLCFDLFTKLSSHSGIDSCISVHSGTASKSPGKWYSLVQQNSNFLVIFRNIANRMAIGEISKRIFPYGKNFIQRCLTEITEICGPYAYVVVDASLKNPLNNKFGIRANIFEENGIPMLLCKSPSSYLGRH